MTSVWSQFVRFFNGAGRINPPDPGNMANAPADPPIPSGNYQFIQPTLYGGAGDNQDLVTINSIPPSYQDNAAYPVNLFGLSGLDGGGSTGLVPNPFGTQGNVLYYNQSDGMYYDIGQGILPDNITFPYENTGAF